MFFFLLCFVFSKVGGANRRFGIVPRMAQILPISHHVSVKVSSNFLKELIRRDEMPRPAFRLLVVSKEPCRYAVWKTSLLLSHDL